MTPLVLTLRSAPDQRLDLSALVPQRLVGKSAAEIARMAVQTTRVQLALGDVFRIRAGSPQQIRIEGGSERLDLVGCGMATGELVVEGDVGSQAGRLMTGGRLIIRGRAGPWTASGMRGGMCEIAGSVGDRLGGPLPGEVAGMRGGVVVVRGDAGERAGDRLRRGTIVIEGRAGPRAGSRMIAGTLIVRRTAGPLPGYLMRRGTIVLGEQCDALSPTFVDCGLHDLVAMRLLARFVEPLSARAGGVLRRPLRRLAGDMAVLGQGELFCPPE
jgi:formylmethanofuran dehydrogenase subunit C